MNGTYKFLAVVLATMASLSLDFCAQTPNPRLSIREKPRMSLESIGASRFIFEAFGVPEVPTGHKERYDVADAYKVYSAIIPTVDPDPKTHMWFILTDTLFGHGSLSDQDRKEWKKTRRSDPALDDFFNVNAKTWMLQNKFTLPNPYRLGTPDEIKLKLMSPFSS